MRNALKRSILFIVIIAFSFLFGIAFDKICVFVENRTHAIDVAYADTILTYCEQYDVAPAWVFAVIKTETDFSNVIESKDGKVGVMLLSPATFDFIKNEIVNEPNVDDGLIFNPEKNIEYGIAYLNYLKTKYANEEMVLTAYFAGTDVIEGWLVEQDASENGMILQSIPDRAVRKNVSSVMHHYSIYSRILNQTETR